MSTRDHILAALVREVLGPRDGSHEFLPENQDPRDEYITGMLVSARAPRPPDDIDADIDQVIEETSSEEDQDTQSYAVVPGVFSPLDPKALPRSIGLSFTVEAADGPPQIEICATWARYQRHEQGWEHRPVAFLTGPVRADRDQVWTAAEDVSLQLRSRPLPGGCWRAPSFWSTSPKPQGTDARSLKNTSFSHRSGCIAAPARPWFPGLSGCLSRCALPRAYGAGPGPPVWRHLESN